jgi:hypothetical protein
MFSFTIAYSDSGATIAGDDSAAITSIAPGLLSSTLVTARPISGGRTFAASGLTTAAHWP